MNILPTTVSSREVSATLLELVSDLLDVEDVSDEKKVTKTDLIGGYLSHFHIPIQLISTGSTVEHTKLNDRLDGSDLDIMVFPQNVKVGKDCIEYNKRFPCFVRVNSSVALQLGSEINGKYLPTSIVKNMEFLGQHTFSVVIDIILNANKRSNELHISSESSVGLKYSILSDFVVPGLLTCCLDEANTEIHFSKILMSSIVNQLDSDHDNNIFNLHEFAENILEDVFQKCSMKRNIMCNKKSDQAVVPGGITIGCKKSTQEKEKCLPVSFKKKSNADIVPGLMIDGWPIPAANWITRKRVWPDKEIVKIVVNQGVQLVTKPLPINPNEELDFRLSFSLAERTLANAMNETQRLAIVIVKACNKFAGPADLVSYHIKTAMYWTSENKHASFWRLDNLSACVKHVIGYLLFCVRAKILPHYFIPNMNLFAGFDEYSFHELEEKLLKMYHSPISFVQGFIERGGNNEDGVLILGDNDRHAFEKPESSSDRTSMKTAYKQCVRDIISNLLCLPRQHMATENMARIAACRSKLETPEGYFDDIENAVFQLVNETKDCFNSETLLNGLKQFVAKYRTEA